MVDAPPGGPSRDALRAASLFTNLDFEDVDADGNARDWTCACAPTYAEGACKTSTKAVHGARSLLLPSGCIAYQDTTKFDASKSARFDGFAADGAAFPADMMLFAYGATAREETFIEHLSAPSASWTPIASSGVVSTKGYTSLRLYLGNSNGSMDSLAGPAGEPMEVDDLVVLQDGPNPPPRVASILRSTHIDDFRYLPGKTPASIYVPLPIDWATQTPLDLDLKVTPASIVDHITYATEANPNAGDPNAEPSVPNWGATITFVPGASAEHVELRWDAVVLTRMISEAERPEVYAANGSTDAWLRSTAFVDSAYPAIATTAKSLAPETASSLEKMNAVLQWTSAAMTGTGEMTGLDATSVYESRVSSCTGYANLAAAMGRALGVPARHVTNVRIGSSQQMHSIDEFYLGPSLGWRRVEPQDSSSFLQEDYGFILRLVRPGDESPVAGRDSVGGPLIAGIPFREFTETLSGPERFGFAPPRSRRFSDCSHCSDHADRIAVVHNASSAAMASLFGEARSAWQADLAVYAKGGAPGTGAGSPLAPARVETRRKAASLRSFADVRAFVDALTK